MLDMREFYTAYNLFNNTLTYQKDKKNLRNTFLKVIQDAAYVDESLSRQLAVKSLCTHMSSEYDCGKGIVSSESIIKILGFWKTHFDYFGLENAGDIKKFENFNKVFRTFLKELLRAIKEKSYVLKMRKKKVREVRPSL